MICHSTVQLSRFLTLKKYYKNAHLRIPTQKILILVASMEQDSQCRRDGETLFFFILYFLCHLNLGGLDI